MTPAERLDVFRRLATALGWTLVEEDKLPAEPNVELGIRRASGADTDWIALPYATQGLPFHLAFCGHVIEAVQARDTDDILFQIQNRHVAIGALVGSCTTRGDLALACARAALAALDALGETGGGE